MKKWTLRRVYSALKYIQVRKHNDYVASAALHGIKLETIKFERKAKVKPKDKKFLDEIMKKAVEEKKRKMKEERFYVQ